MSKATPVSMREFLAACPTWLMYRLEAMSAHTGVEWSGGGDSDDGEWVDDKRKPAPLGLREAEVLGSLIKGMVHHRHAIVLDLDESECGFELVPSSTPGHAHLYFNTSASWEDVLKLLDALAACRIIQDGWVRAAKERGEMFVRPPWIRKGHEKEDAQRTLLESLEPEVPAKQWEIEGLTLDEWLEQPALAQF